MRCGTLLTRASARSSRRRPPLRRRDGVSPERKPSLTPEEARRLHHEALVIDAQQPPVINGFLYTERMKAAVAAYARQGLGRDEVAPHMSVLAAQEIQTSADARRQYLDLWRRSGVTVACGTFSGAHR